MGSQVSHRQKKDLAKYYTSLLGNQEANSVNAYMQLKNNNNTEQSQKKKRFKKKKRAASQAAASKQRSAESQKNLLTIENDRHDVVDGDEYGLDQNAVGYQSVDVADNNHQQLLSESQLK